VRQALEAWGQQQSALPLLVEKPGRTKAEAPRRWHGQSVMRHVEVEDSAGRAEAEPPRRWHGQSVMRHVEVEYSAGRVAQEELRFVVVHSSQLAQQQPPAYTAAQAKEAEAVTAHVKQVQTRWFACEADAEGAIAEYEGQGPGRRGRPPRPWRYHAVRYHSVAETRRTRRTRRGRP